MLILHLFSFISYWTNPEKINSVEHLEQMGESLWELLNEIRRQKVCIFLLNVMDV